MSVRGVFASHSSIVGDRANTLSSRILMTGYAGTAPLLALSSGMPEERVGDTSWSWVEDSHISGNTSCPGGATDVATSLTVSDTNVWTKNAILLVETTGEYMFVVSVDSATTVTVQRGQMGTTAAAIGVNATIQLIGTAFAEGSGKPDQVSTFGDTLINFVQIFKTGWGITGTAMAIQYVTGNKLSQNKAQAMQQHAESIERSFWFGRKSIRMYNSQELRTSNGIVPQISAQGGLVESANYKSAGAGQMATAGIQEFMRKVFQQNAKGYPNERIAFTGDVVLNLVQGMIRLDTRYDLTLSDTEFGLQVYTLSFVGNKLKLMTHPLFNENAYWTKNLYVLHPGLISKRKIRDTWTEDFSAKRGNNNGVDAEDGYVADELGFQLKGAKLCGIMTNITTAVVS